MEEHAPKIKLSIILHCTVERKQVFDDLHGLQAKITIAVEEPFQDFQNGLHTCPTSIEQAQVKVFLQGLVEVDDVLSHSKSQAPKLSRPFADASCARLFVDEIEKRLQVDGAPLGEGLSLLEPRYCDLHSSKVLNVHVAYAFLSSPPPGLQQGLPAAGLPGRRHWRLLRGRGLILRLSAGSLSMAHPAGQVFARQALQQCSQPLPRKFV
mmetsp:Transcript_58261/g.123674  ORF Transcript_58261/g.123674 Transcript_58261/m.123674 type:complete len:209 (-) Transcript_58261:226-852(-)